MLAALEMAAIFTSRTSESDSRDARQIWRQVAVQAPSVLGAELNGTNLMPAGEVVGRVLWISAVLRPTLTSRLWGVWLFTALFDLPFQEGPHELHTTSSYILGFTNQPLYLYQQKVSAKLQGSDNKARSI